MKRKVSTSRKVFMVFNYFILIVLALLCLVPFINVLAISLSDKAIAATGEVWLWPKGFTTSIYSYLLQKQPFWQAFLIALERVALGGGIGVVVTMLTAYPLSKTKQQLKGRTLYAWFFFITMLFHGGLIPTYSLIRDLKMLDSVWALILPRTINAYNIVLMLNFFRQIPPDIEEAATIDGANQFQIFSRIYLPVSLPSVATISLFVIVAHWNAWFDGLIYMNSPAKYPLQSYLQMIIIQSADAAVQADYGAMAELSDRTLKCAQIIVSVIPILCVYPFLQKYFTTGMTLGSVKG